MKKQYKYLQKNNDSMCAYVCGRERGGERERERVKVRICVYE